MFVGRRAELQFLESHYRAKDSRILVLYGRKGVGKTALLREFTRGRDFAYYAARPCSEQEQRYQWSRELASQGQYMEIFPSYRTLFETCLKPFPSLGGRPVLVLDEFHFFVKADPDFMPQLIRFVQEHSVLVVLCCSAAGWVENSMISRIGRSAASIKALLKVRELKFEEIRELFPGYYDEDAVFIYAALGGNPGLWNSFSQELSARENMIRFFLTPGSRLCEEMAVYMAEELREPAVYNTILATMASGVSKLNDLFVHTGFSRAKISVYLKNLMELDLVEKVYSFQSGGYENTRKGIYRICNSYVNFYYRFLFPHQSDLQTCDSSQFYSLYVEPDYRELMEDAYRKICRESLAKECSQVGEWIGKDGTIDIVARKNSGEILTALCRYTFPISGYEYEQLKVNLRQARINPSEIRIYTENGFHSDFPENVRKQIISPRSVFGH